MPNAATAEPIAARVAALQTQGLLKPLGLEDQAKQLRDQLMAWRNDTAADNATRAGAADALAPLGDERFGFEPDRWFLPGQRARVPEGNGWRTLSGAEEPVPGFVLIPDGAFVRGQAGEENNPPTQIKLPSFCIARTLTTVAQWSAFVDDHGYDDDRWWCDQGRAWREGALNRNHLDNEATRQHLGQRPANQRRAPWRWSEQRAFTQRPVWGITWFEARAYANWLSEQLAREMAHAGLHDWQVRLPTEDQWERSARANTPDSADSRRWVWGNDGDGGRRFANLETAKLGQASCVGLFQGNPIGLFDLAGNLWEWQDNLYAQGTEADSRLRLGKSATMAMDTVEGGNSMPAMRGGSWKSQADAAMCGHRAMNLPDYFSDRAGLRTVLTPIGSDADL
jgi:iron(II)-dependent oxidoreductase